MVRRLFFIFRIPGTDIYVPTVAVFVLVLLLIALFAIVAYFTDLLYGSSDKSDK